MSSPDSRSKRRHVVALDALRGIAAVVVLLGHCTLVYDIPRAARLGFDLVFNQRAAVIVFFVLSGYVLCLSWRNGAGDLIALLKFYVRRAFRLVPALWVATLAAMIWLALFPPPAKFGPISHWAQAQYVAVPIARQLRAFLAIDNALVPPTWTITIEVLGSLALPAIAMILAKGRAWATFLIAALWILALATGELPSRLGYLAFFLEFALGAALAIYGPHLGRAAALRAGWLGVVMLFGSRPLWNIAMTGALQAVEFRINAAVPAICEALGAVLLVAALAAPDIKAPALSHGVLRRIGEWSYSIYLIHFVVLRAAIYAIPPGLTPAVATLWLTMIVSCVSLALAAGIFRFVEMPGIALGKQFTRLSIFQARARTDKLV